MDMLDQRVESLCAGSPFLLLIESNKANFRKAINENSIKLRGQLLQKLLGFQIRILKFSKAAKIEKGSWQSYQ